MTPLSPTPATGADAMTAKQPTLQGSSATRDELIDALTRLDVRVPISGPVAGMINAESMADALIEALDDLADLEDSR